MDKVTAGGAPSPNGFVCPVIETDGVLSSPKSIEINGANSILGPMIRVPDGATNGDGSGVPSGDFSSPGDTDYTAIWLTG